MHRRTFLATLLATPAAAQAAPLKVVATFSILADLVHQVGGPAVTIATLVGPGADAHVFQPRPSDLRTLGAAEVLVQNGLGFEGWMDRMAQSAGFHGRRITAAAAVARRTFQEAGRTVTDPHAWQDPRNAALMVDAIAQGLAAAAPAEADAVRARAQAYQARIAEADTAIQRAFDAIPPARRQIITTHDAFGYYGARYGITVRAAQGISTDAEPTPRDLARLVAQIRRDRIRTVFIETMTSPRLAETLAREAGATVGPPVFSDSLSPPGGPAPTYLDMLRHNTGAFTAAMASP